MIDARYLRLADLADVSLRDVLTALGEPAPSIVPDAWMADRGYLRIYDHLPPLGPNQRHTTYTQAIDGDHVDRFWQVGQDLPDAEYQAKLAAAAAAAAARAAEIADIDAARQFARLVALRAMSPAGVSSYIATRYSAPAADLPSANAILTKMRDDIETLAIAVAILARRL